MNRLVGRHGGVISAALDLIPERLRPLVTADLFVGADPGFAGLHRYKKGPDGRAYRDTMHVCYPFHVTDRRTTLIIPHPDEPYAVEKIVHEFGHILHERLDYEPSPAPVTKYAQTSRFEAFAEAFTTWINPNGCYQAIIDNLHKKAPEVVDLFERLSE